MPTGNYDLTPTKEGYIFTPEDKQITVSTNDLTGQDFTGSPTESQTYSISGRVYDFNEQKLPSWTVQISHTSNDTTYNDYTITNENGDYIFNGLHNGITYIVKPFDNPPNLYFDYPAEMLINGENYTEIFFWGDDHIYRISGVLSGLGELSGLTVSLSGDSTMTAQTNADGYYEFSVTEGTYTITPPSVQNYNVYPVNYSELNVVEDINNIDFTYTQALFISGRVTNHNPTPLSFWTVIITYTIDAVNYTNSTLTTQSGHYVFTDLQDGVTYNVRPVDDPDLEIFFPPGSTELYLDGNSYTGIDFDTITNPY